MFLDLTCCQKSYKTHALRSKNSSVIGISIRKMMVSNTMAALPDAALSTVLEITAADTARTNGY